MKLAAAFLLSAPLLAQGAYINSKPGDATCPKVEATTAALESGVGSVATTGGKIGGAATGVLINQQGEVPVPKGKRKNVGKFACMDEKGKAHTIAEAKGKVVIIALWGTSCEPSAKLLTEIADLQPKGEKFGFEAWPVNFDEGGWAKVRTFVTRNSKTLGATRLYIPGTGEQGVGNFMDEVLSLPAFFVVDREGNLAHMMVGYRPNMAGDLLKRYLVEK